MYPSTLSAFQSWTADLEGGVPWMYLDDEGLVTTAIGNLIDASSTFAATTTRKSLLTRMYQSALDAFQKWTTDGLEGRVPWMYVDGSEPLGLVHTGIGNLIDAGAASSAPWTPALAWPWKHGASGPLASQDEVITAWKAVKAAQNLKTLGGYNKAFPALSDLRVSDADIDSKFVATRDNFIATMKANGFPNLDSMPADAQMGMMGMAWALGPAFSKGYPHFTAAINAGNYNTAALESHISNGALKRNLEQALMFSNAAAVVANGLDPSKLYFPNTATQTQKAAATFIASNVAGSALLATGGALFLTGYALRALFRKGKRR